MARAVRKDFLAGRFAGFFPGPGLVGGGFAVAQRLFRQIFRRRACRKVARSLSCGHECQCHRRRKAGQVEALARPGRRLEAKQGAAHERDGSRPFCGNQTARTRLAPSQPLPCDSCLTPVC